MRCLAVLAAVALRATFHGVGRPGSRVGLLAVALCPLLAPAAQAESTYLGSDTCLACHQELGDGFARTRHGKLFSPERGLTERMKQGCEACHGPGSAHVEAGGGPLPEGMLSFAASTPASIEAENGVCLDCHAGGDQLYWDGSVHDSRGLACTSCHSSHDAHSTDAQLKGRNETETCTTCHIVQRAQQFKHSRMPLREGHMDCGSCHNPHGAVTRKLIVHPSVNDNCLSCHADKRGPFLWEHAPVNESCLSCHTPHASSKRAMLRLNPPRLCQQCHVSSRHPSDPRRDPTSIYVVSGSCLNCHINVHGSNHPEGWVFAR